MVPFFPRMPQTCSQKCGAIGERTIICHSMYLITRALEGSALQVLQTSR